MSQTVSDSRLQRFWSTRPVTLAVVIVVVVLHAGVRLAITPEHDASAAYRAWGLPMVQSSAEHPDLSGPFDLWSGEWWRVPLGGLHHAGWWHLGLCSLAFVTLGGLMEPKLRPAAYGLFLLGAFAVTGLPRWLGAESVPVWVMARHPAIGLSGVVYAQFGGLLLLRRNDAELAGRFGEGAILIGMAFGLASLAFSLVAPSDAGLDNLAHLAGLPYGLVWGLAFSVSPIRKGVLVAFLIAAHFSLWPAFQRVIRPVENARYHWWLAEKTSNPEEKQSHYEKALERDPGIPTLWRKLAELKFQTQGPQDAWRTLLKGFKDHGDLGQVKPLSEAIWAAFSTKKERQDAWREAERELPDFWDTFGPLVLSPPQMTEFFLERGELLDAWRVTMERLTGLSPALSHASEETSLAKSIWQELDPGERPLALLVLDQELGLDRRAWHLVLIPNRDLISHYHDQGELLWAWEAAINVIRDDPAFREHGKTVARRIWLDLPTELRRERARNMVNDVFRPEGLSWQIELDILSEATRQRYRLDQAVSLPQDEFDDVTYPSPGRALPIDPDDPESAALGISL